MSKRVNGNVVLRRPYRCQQARNTTIPCNNNQNNNKMIGFDENKDGSGADSSLNTSEQANSVTRQELVFSVDNMTCGGCGSHVRNLVEANLNKQQQVQCFFRGLPKWKVAATYQRTSLVFGWKARTWHRLFRSGDLMVWQCLFTYCCRYQRAALFGTIPQSNGIRSLSLDAWSSGRHERSYRKYSWFRLKTTEV